MTDNANVVYEVNSYKRCGIKDKLFVPKDSTFYDVIWVKITQKVKRKSTVTELSFSRYDTETEWYLDCMFVNNLPSFNHGDGCRICHKRYAQHELKEVIERHVSQNTPVEGV